MANVSQRLATGVVTTRREETWRTLGGGEGGFVLHVRPLVARPLVRMCISCPYTPTHTDAHTHTHSHTHSHTQTQRRSEALNLWKIARNCGMLDWRILGENLGRIVGNLKNLNAPLHPKGLRNQNHWIMFEEAQRIPKNPRESLKISKNPPRIPWHPKNPQESKDYTIRIIGFSSRNPQESPRIPKNPQESSNIFKHLNEPLKISKNPPRISNKIPKYLQRIHKNPR